MKVCANCSGNGGPWPDNPIMCGGVPCPVCNGVCEACLGADPETLTDTIEIPEVDK